MGGGNGHGKKNTFVLTVMVFAVPRKSVNGIFLFFFFFLTRRIAATSRETHRNRGRGQDPVVVVLLAGHRLRLGRQQFEEHQGQRQVDDQYYQHQLLSREPVLQR